jgi:hypothetical protein
MVTTRSRTRDLLTFVADAIVLMRAPFSISLLKGDAETGSKPKPVSIDAVFELILRRTKTF